MDSINVAVAAGKGGVSKTTTAIALSAEYARLGLKTALRDLDPQAGATLMLGQVPVENPWETPPVEITDPRTGSRFLLYPAGHRLATARLADLLRLIELGADELDILVIDTPPLLGEQMSAALQRAHLVIAPHHLTVGSLSGVAGVSQLATRLGVTAPIRRLIVMPKDRRGITSEVRSFASEADTFRGPYRSELPEDVAVVHAEAAGVPVTWLGNSRIATAYRGLAQEVLNDLGVAPNEEAR